VTATTGWRGSNVKGHSDSKLLLSAGATISPVRATTLNRAPLSLPPPPDLHQALEKGRLGYSRDRRLWRHAFVALGALCGEVALAR
jgi:hypothetical protein